MRLGTGQQPGRSTLIDAEVANAVVRGFARVGFTTYESAAASLSLEKILVTDGAQFFSPSSLTRLPSSLPRACWSCL